MHLLRKDNICAEYIGKKFSSLLGNENFFGSLKIHSIFRRVINIESSQQLFSVVTPEIGRMANYVVISNIESEDFLSLDISPKVNCEIVNSNLVLNNKLSIDLSKALVWEGKIDKGFRWKEEELNKENLQALNAALRIYAAENSAYRKIYDLEEPYLINATENLCSLASKDNAASSVKSLIGLGAGLTPMGDDLLTGFLSAVSSCKEDISVIEALKKNILENLCMTNSISSSMLLNAIDCIYHDYIQNLVYAVACEETDRVFLCAKKLLKIGATSGTDLATGIYLGFKSISQGKAR
jgi:hypothetical protein